LIQYKYKQYYEKQVMLRGGHIQERKKFRWIWLMWFLFKNECRIVNSVEVTIRRLRKKGEKEREWNNLGYNTYIHGNTQWNSLYGYPKQNSHLFFKNRKQEGKTILTWGVWYQWEGGGYKEKLLQVNMVETCTHACK
jgi:hypothetical protein